MLKFGYLYQNDKIIRALPTSSDTYIIKNNTASNGLGIMAPEESEPSPMVANNNPRDEHPSKPCKRNPDVVKFKSNDEHAD